VTDPPPSSPPIIELKHVDAYRGAVCVFHDLSLVIPAGCHTVILGPNGAGKSTLLKLLTRELYPVDRDGAVVRLFGRDRWNVWDLRHRLGIVSLDLQQEYGRTATGLDVILSGFYSSLHVYDHQRFSKADRARAEALLHELGVEHLKERPYAEMSTGEQRRVLLGRALVHDPDALILDEPTTGLDVKATAEYLTTVRTLMRRGRTVILVTHHIHEIPPEIERVVLLKQGRIVVDGAKRELMTDRELTALFDIPVTVCESEGFYHLVFTMT